MKIPVTFSYEGKDFSGYLDEVNGMGNDRATMWHLMVNRYYWGMLQYVQGEFRFSSNSINAPHLSDHLGNIVMLWYQ